MPPPALLSPDDLADLAQLEAAVVAADGGRLKLEWRVLREGRVEALLSREGGRLTGFLGLYAFGSSVELVGAVDPAARRRGVGGALLDAALARCREREAGDVHALVLTTAPKGPEDPRTRLWPAGPDDAPLVARLLEEGFGVPLDGTWPDTLLVEVDGTPVGTLRVTRDGTAAAVHAFVVTPRRQGRGVGRDVLSRVCRAALADGAERVELEVAVDNPSALHLYTSTGFVHVAGEDYWSLQPG